MHQKQSPKGKAAQTPIKAPINSGAIQIAATYQFALRRLGLRQINKAEKDNWIHNFKKNGQQC